MKKVQLILAAAVSMLAAQPCAAASDQLYWSGAAQRNGVFAGASVRLQLGRSGELKPLAGLRLTPIREISQPGSVPLRIMNPDKGIEVRVTGAGKPVMFVSGQSLANLNQQNVSGERIVLAGVVVVLVLSGLLLLLKESGVGAGFPGP